MSYRILIGNLSPDTSFGELHELLRDVGTVRSISFIADHIEVKKEINLTTLTKARDSKWLRLANEAVTLCAIEMTSKSEAVEAISRLEMIELPSFSDRAVLFAGPHGPGDRP